MCGEAVYRGILATLWTETFLYGFYVLLFLVYLYIHFSRRSSQSNYLFASMVIMFTLSTGLMIVSLVQDLLTPALTGRSVCDGDDCGICEGEVIPTRQSTLNTLLNIVYLVIFTTNQLAADALLTYRCYVVWQMGRRVIILPSCMVAVSAAVGYVQAGAITQLYLLNNSVTQAKVVDQARFDQLIDLDNRLNYVTSGLSIATNVLLTMMIAGRIWWITRELQQALGKRVASKYRSAMAIIIESGAIYSASQIIQLATNQVPIEYGIIVSDAIGQLVGIVPTMIMVRVGLGKGVEDATVNESGVPAFISPLSNTEDMRFAPAGSIATSTLGRETEADRGKALNSSSGVTPHLSV